MADDFKLTGSLVIRGIQGLDTEIPKLRRQLDTLSKSTTVNIGFEKSAAGVEKLARSTKQARAEITSTVTSLQDFSDKAALALRRFTAFSIAAGATFGSLRLAFSGLKNAAVFERELIKVRQVSGATANSIANLRDEITRLGNTLAAPASELANVAKTLSQAGFRISEVKTLLEGLAQTRLAATFGTIQDTTEGIIAISGQFKIKVSEMSDALGIINAVAAKYAVESEDLISAVRRTGGVFSAASSGVSEGTQALSEFAAVFSSVRQTTRQANETIATGLRTIFARLERPKTINYFKDLGIDLTDASGKFIGVYQAIQKIGQAIDGLDTRSLKFAEIVDIIGGARQLGVVVPVLKEWRLQQEILNTALGGTKSLLGDAALPLQTLVEQVNILANNFNAFSRDVFNSNSFQFLAKEAINFANAIVRVADSIAGLLPLFAALGVARLGASIAREGAVGYLTKRLTTGHPGPGIHHGRAAGGYIPGTGSGDKIPIMAEPGEFVLRKGAAQKIGPAGLKALNHIDKFNMGGFVGRLRGYAGGGVIGDPLFRGDSEQFLKEGQALGASLEKLLSIVNKIGKSFESVEEANIAYQEYIGKLAKNPTPSKLSGGGTSSGSLNIKTDTTNSVVEQARIKQRVLANLTASRAANAASNYNENRSVSLGSSTNSLNIPTERREFVRRDFSLGGKYRRPEVSGPSLSLEGGPLEPGVANDFINNPRARINPFAGLPTTSQNLDAKINALTLNSRKNLPIVNKTFQYDPLANKPILVNDSLDNLTDRDQIIRRALGPGVPKSSVSPLTESELGYQIRDNAFGAEGAVFGGSTTSLASEATRKQYAKDVFGRLKGPGTSSQTRLQRLRSFRTSPDNYNRDTFLGDAAYGLDAGFTALGSNVISAGQEGFDAVRRGTSRFATKTFNRARTIGRYAPGAIGRGVKGIAGKVGRGDPATLGILAAGVQYGGDRLGVDPVLTGGLSGALGGAAVGSAFGGPYGAAAGAIAGGVLGVANASQQKDLDAVNKELTKSSKDLTKAFEDLSTGGVAKLDAAIKNQLDLTNKKSGIESRTLTEKLGAVAGNSSIFNLLPNTGRTIGASLNDDFAKSSNSASSLANDNAVVAESARERIKLLVSRGRKTDITDQLIQASFSDDAKKLEGLAVARKSKTDNGATLRNLTLEARGNLIKDTEINKGVGFDLALKNLDTFANRLDKTTSLLGLFNTNLEESQNAIQTSFDTASGNFSINRNFQNPFDNAEALSVGQIRSAVGNLESFTGQRINDQARGTLEAAPILNDLPNIINAEREKAEKAGFKITDTGKFIDSLLSNKNSPLGNLPGRVKNDLSSVFGNLAPEDTQAYLSGEVDNKNAQEITNKIGQITDKTVATFKKLQDSSNELAKTFLVNAANQRSVLVASDIRLGANRQDAIANSIATMDSLRGTPTNPLAAIGLQQNSLRELTGLQDVFPTNVTQNINALLKERASLESNVNIGELEKSRRLSEVNAKLTTNKEALDKLASSAIGLAEIQTKLSEVQGRQLGLADSVINDALGGNQSAKIRGQVALQAFQQGGLGRVQGLGLNPDDLKSGISQQEQRLSFTQGEQAAKDFKLEIAKALNKQGAGVLIPAGEAAENDKTFKDLDKQKVDLLAAANTALATQTIAIEQQRKLLASNLEEFDKVVTNKFVAGITQLAAVVQQLSVPETITIQATHIHQFQFTGLDIANLEPTIKKIAEAAVNGGLSKLTDGQIKNGKRIPGKTAAALEEGFGG